MFSKPVQAIIFAFIVGGLVGYGFSTTQALTAAAAVAEDASIPDARQVEITAPTPIVPCPPTQDTVNEAGIPATPNIVG